MVWRLTRVNHLTQVKHGHGTIYLAAEPVPVPPRYWPGITSRGLAGHAIRHRPRRTSAIQTGQRSRRTACTWRRPPLPPYGSVRDLRILGEFTPTQALITQTHNLIVSPTGF